MAITHDTTQTIKIVHDTIFTKGENAYDLVSKIDTMYQNAWARLLVFGGIIMAIATIVMPWWLNRERKKQAIIDKENDKIAINKKMDEIKAEMAKEFESKMMSELIRLGEQVETELYSVKAANFYLLAESKMDKKDYPYAFINYVTAIRYSIGAKDLANIKGTLTNMIANCIPNLTIKELHTTQKMYSFQIEGFLKEIEALDTGRMLFVELNKFRQAIGAVVQKEKKEEG